MLPQLRAIAPAAGMLYSSKNFIFNLFSIVLAGYHAGDIGMLSRKHLNFYHGRTPSAKMGKLKLYLPAGSYCCKSLGFSYLPARRQACLPKLQRREACLRNAFILLILSHNVNTYPSKTFAAPPPPFIPILIVNYALIIHC